jgi:hypothetical protein
MTVQHVESQDSDCCSGSGTVGGDEQQPSVPCQRRRSPVRKDEVAMSVMRFEMLYLCFRQGSAVDLTMAIARTACETTRRKGSVS